MTDLERHWDDLPVGAAPVDAILTAARAEQARGATRRSPGERLRRSLTTTAALGGIAAAFVAGTVVGSDDVPGSRADDVTPAAFHGELQAAESCDDLLQRYIERALDQVTEYGWTGQVPGFRNGDFFAFQDGPILDSPAMEAPGLALDLEASRNYAALPRTVTSTSGESGTNVQEEGVDEPDVVKTDGTMLVRITGSNLTTYSVTGAEVRKLGGVQLPDFADGEILLSGDTVVAIGHDAEELKKDDNRRFSYAGVPLQTRVVSIDVSDASEPEITHTVDYDAALASARLHGDAVRVVLSSGLPDLGFVQPGSDDGKKTALEVNKDLIRDTTLEDWLPRQAADGGAPQQFLDCANVAIPRADLPLGTMSVVGFTADDPTDVDPLGLAADAPVAYESPDHLYLANSPITFGCWEWCPLTDSIGTGGADDTTTYVYDFAIDHTTATYVGAGEVDGVLRDRWSIDEHDGVVRLALGPTKEHRNGNAIVMLQADGDVLEEIGRVDGMGVNEDIQSVRWFDDLALLVTFRQTDPFYAVDLSDQRAPKLMGELKIPGFSSYLHPLGGLRVIGIGEGPQSDDERRGWGAQAGLFDVTDLTDPQRLDVLGYGRNTQARAGEDPRQFTWLPAERTVLTVIRKNDGVYVSTLGVGGGELANTMTKVLDGWRADDVRTVPLPSGKVVLVAGDDVRFFDLG